MSAAAVGVGRLAGGSWQVGKPAAVGSFLRTADIMVVLVGLSGGG